MTKFTAILVLMLFPMLQSWGQVQTKDSIFLSGLIMDKDSLTIMPFTNISINGQMLGSANEKGRFAMWVVKKDTLTFSFIGYRNSRYIVADSLREKQFIIGIFMGRDTIAFEQTIVLPRLDKSYIAYELTQFSPNRNMYNATNNLNLANYQAQTLAPINEKWDASMNQKYAANNQQSSAIYRGQLKQDQMLSITAIIPLGMLIYKKLLQTNELQRYELSSQEEEILRKKFIKKSNELKLKEKPFPYKE